MPYCCAPECTNHPQKDEEVSFHRIPKDITMRNAWIARLRRGNDLNPKGSRVCSDHFTEDCFEINHTEQVTGERKRRVLKKDAIPSLFAFGPASKQPRLASVAREEGRMEPLLHVSIFKITFCCVQCM